MKNSKQIKICHLTSVHSFRDTRIFLKECCSLASDRNYEVCLVAPDAPPVNQLMDNVNLVRGVDRIHKNRLERFSRSVYQTYKTACSLDADIYHFHDPELIPVGLLLKAGGKKVIYDVHEDLPRQTLSKSYIPKRIRKVSSFLLEAIEDFSVQYFDAIVTATPHIRDRFFKENSHTIDINNYPILSEFHIANSSWKDKQKIVCYVGAITKIRGIFSIVEAMSQVQGKLLLGGNFSKIQDENRASIMRGWSNVEKLGYLDRSEVSQVFAGSMAGLVLFYPVPNHINAQPNKMFEYMSSGIPVIASNFPLWQEIIEGNNCGICVDPLNSQDIARAIQWIFDHPQEAEQMGQNGRKAIEQKYNWETEAEKLIDVYLQL